MNIILYGNVLTLYGNVPTFDHFFTDVSLLLVLAVWQLVTHEIYLSRPHAALAALLSIKCALCNVPYKSASLEAFDVT